MQFLPVELVEFAPAESPQKMAIEPAVERSQVADRPATPSSVSTKRIPTRATPEKEQRVLKELIHESTSGASEVNTVGSAVTPSQVQTGEPKYEHPAVEAEPSEQVKPEIPDELKSTEYRSYVRVRVEIAADGSATAALKTSSGNAEIDRRVLEALSKWKWKPALLDGRAIASVRYFKFEFEVAAF